MAMKSITLIIALVVVLVATQAEAQLLPPIRLPPIVLPPIRLPPIRPIRNLFSITGNVSCSVNGSIAVNGTNPIPPFPNARVQLLCNLTVRGTAITNRAGAFVISVRPPVVTLNDLLSSCRAVVATPLSACNATLPSTGTLQAPLRVVGSRVVGLLNITTISAGPFVLTRTL